MSNLNIITSLTKPQLEELVATHTSKNGILRALGVPPGDNRCRTALTANLESYGIPIEHMRRVSKYTIPDVKRAVKVSLCISDVLDKIGLTKHGDNFKTVRNLISKHNIDDSHFSSVDARVLNGGNRRWTADNIFVEHSPMSRGALRSYVIKFNVLPEYECSRCTNEGVWNDEILKLNVDHINGVNNDNRVENLRWLCPNCHSQTNTFGTQSRSNHK